MKIRKEKITVIKYGRAYDDIKYTCPKCNIEFPWDRIGEINKFCYNCGIDLDWYGYRQVGDILQKQ